MYYDSKKEKKKDRAIIIIFMLIIIALLCFLIFKIDNVKVPEILGEDYQTDKLSTDEGEKVEKSTSEIINSVVKCVVGISKLQQNGSSIFLDNSEDKLGLGSGIILTDSGYILTNQHVAGNKYNNCYVTLENGQVYSGTVSWADSNLDLAIVKITANNLEYLNLADSDNLNLADEVYAIGNPIGIEFQRTVTKGIISGIDRTIKISGSDTYMEDLIQTDATINEGNSGGPLINTKGELIGVNTIKITDAEGIGFAVPINIVKPILEKLAENGKFDEPYLGIFGYDKEVIPYLGADLNIDKGVYVATIATDGPLFNKGILVGDIITKIDNIEINKMNDLKKYIYTKNPNDNVKLTVTRGGKEFEIEVKLGLKI